jgi:MFS family permease
VLRLKGIRPTVVLLGLASLLNDAASEIIYPLLPVFLSAQLAAGPFAIGMIEAVADALASLLKWVSGWWSDRVPRRSPFVVTGYAVATVARFFIAIASSWGQVFAARLMDRAGKGIRSAPRDALISDVTDREYRGRAFGFHRAMDHSGAVIGPIAGALMVGVLLLPLKTVFMIAVIPGAIGAVTLLLLLREEPRDATTISKAGSTSLPHSFRPPIRAIAIFCLANSSDAFLLLHAHLVGIQTHWLPILWAANHLVKASLSTAGGSLSDRIDRRFVIAAGWGLYSLVYFLFPLATSVTGFAVMFVVYAIPFALTEGTERAWIADFVPADAKGRAFGVFHLVQGLGTLAGSAIFGLYYEHVSRMGAFHLAGGIAAISAFMALAVRPTAAPAEELPQ